MIIKRKNQERVTCKRRYIDVVTDKQQTKLTLSMATLVIIMTDKVISFYIF